jgi:signal transduction histidine kinase
MIQFLQALMWTTAIINIMMGLLVYSVFRNEDDRSARYWAMGCLLMGSGMVILTIRQYLPSVVGFALNNFIMIYAMVLFRNSFWIFAREEFRPSPYLLLFCLYHGGVIWLMSFTSYKQDIGWFAAVNWTLLYAWLLLDAAKLRGTIKNTSFTVFLVMSAFGLVAWSARIYFASNYQIVSASDPQTLNVISLFVAHVALIGQQFVYFAVRFTDEKNKKTKILELSTSVENLWRERDEISKARQTDRENLIRDMHDGFGSQLTSLRILADHGRLSSAEFSQSLTDIYSELHLIIDTLNQPETKLEDALADLRYRLMRRLPAEHVQLHWQVELSEAPRLPSRITLHMLRILQEAITNSLRHGAPNNIWVIIAYYQATETFTVSVRDDGIGFDEKAGQGRGLSNMKVRAREIGAVLDLKRLDQGTEVKLTVRSQQSGTSNSFDAGCR